MSADSGRMTFFIGKKQRFLAKKELLGDSFPDQSGQRPQEGGYGEADEKFA